MERRLKIFLVLFFCIIVLSLFQCKIYHSSSVSGELISHSDCLNSTSGGDRSSAEDIDSNYEIIRYKYEDGVLRLTHENSVFNCCPGEINATVSIKNSSIVINEKEKSAECSCMCLYKLDYKIDGLTPSVYNFTIFSKYIPEENNKITFTIDLLKNSQGVFYFQRDTYPWI